MAGSGAGGGARGGARGGAGGGAGETHGLDVRVLGQGHGLRHH